VRRTPDKARVIAYRCESCGQAQLRLVSPQAEGICHRCDEPMRIDDLFVDRRRVEVPVLMDRRAA
jgi:hypothetical protein